MSERCSWVNIGYFQGPAGPGIEPGGDGGRDSQLAGGRPSVNWGH